MAEKAKELWRCSTGESRKQNQKDGGCCYQTFLASIQILVTHENRIFQHPCITVICFVTKFPSKRKSTSYTPERKTWQWNQKPSIWRCISKLKTWWFSIVMLALRGGVLIFCNLVSPLGIFTPSNHATVQIPSSADLRLEHWIHACAIQDISGRFFQGSSWDTPLNPKIPQKATQSKETKNWQKSLFSFQKFISNRAGFAETSASFQTIGRIHQGVHTRRRSNHVSTQSFKYTDQPCCISAWHS